MVRLLELNMVYLHPWIIGELACGKLKNRGLLLDLADLSYVVMASDEEVMTFLERHKLFGRGVGWVDLHLLASAILTNCPFWTTDRALSKIALELDVAFTPSM
jgi:predicted nucleic acid-binding protein